MIVEILTGLLKHSVSGEEAVLRGHRSVVDHVNVIVHSCFQRGIIVNLEEVTCGGDGLKQQTVQPRIVLGRAATTGYLFEVSQAPLLNEAIQRGVDGGGGEHLHLVLPEAVQQLHLGNVGGSKGDGGSIQHRELHGVGYVVIGEGDGGGAGSAVGLGDLAGHFLAVYGGDSGDLGGFGGAICQGALVRGLTKGELTNLIAAYCNGELEAFGKESGCIHRYAPFLCQIRQQVKDFGGGNLSFEKQDLANGAVHALRGGSVGSDVDRLIVLGYGGHRGGEGTHVGAVDVQLAGLALLGRGKDIVGIGGKIACGRAKVHICAVGVLPAGVHTGCPVDVEVPLVVPRTAVCQLGEDLVVIVVACNRLGTDDREDGEIVEGKSFTAFHLHRGLLIQHKPGLI